VIVLVRSVAGYRVEQEIELEEIKKSLEKYEPETKQRVRLGEREFDVSTRVLDVGTATNQVFGSMEKVEIKKETFRDYSYQVPILHSGGFVFIRRSPLNLVIHAGGKTADILALELENIVFPNERDMIVRKRLNKEDIVRIYDSVEGGVVKVSTFKDLDLPLLSKSSIYGPNVKGTTDYTRYDSHGNLSYIMFVSRKYSSILISINEICQITFYQSVNDKFAEDFLVNEIF
jgi:hypothetical protein